MARQIYVNLPVENVERATAFYAALGFKKNRKYSDENASCMVWSETIAAMLLDQEFYQQFIDGKHIIDAHTTSGVLLSVTCDSRRAMQRFADAARTAGGRVYTVEVAGQPEGLVGYEVEDLDGHVWEPVWMEPV